jgi:N-carbamoyl-L-amino-acid hydrolase
MADFAEFWASLLEIGRDADGGYLRYSWSDPELDCREWFVRAARERDLEVESDGNGNLYGWWFPPSGPSTEDVAAGCAATTAGVLTGSHLDSVPHGGGYDGALGVASGLLAIDLLRSRGVVPRRPIGVAVFTEEEGSRFGVACLGSRLLTGSLDPATAAVLTDRDGVTLVAAMARAGLDPSRLGPEPARLAGLRAFVELHIEQGRSLVDSGSAVGVASGIWPHGRWRLDIAGEGNHAGTTRMSDRHDPALTLAFTVLAANKAARLHGAHATVGRIAVTPNATNAVPSGASAWLDVRAVSQPALDATLAEIWRKVEERAGRDGTGVTLTAESISPAVTFDPELRDAVAACLGGAPILATGAGHDAGVLAAHVPTAMLFVRNPTGVSHAPAEHATDADCTAGVEALAAVLQELACR